MLTYSYAMGHTAASVFAHTHIQIYKYTHTHTYAFEQRALVASQVKIFGLFALGIQSVVVLVFVSMLL